MFSFFKKITGPASVVRLLEKNYNFNADIDQVSRYMAYAIIGNDHNTSIEYLAAQVKYMDNMDANAVLIAHKFVRVAKQGVINGYITNLVAYQNLLDEVHVAFNIDVDSIQPSSL